MSNLKKIAVAGFAPPEMRKIYNQKLEENITVIDDSMIEVNGEQYEQIEHSAPKLGSSASRMIIMAAALGSFGQIQGASNAPRKRPHVNIVEEYKLIQLKKSKLSRSNRDWVVAQFNYNYKKV